MTASTTLSLPPPQTLYLTLLHRKPPSRPFIYAVLSTRIYCIPGCPSRLARRSNIQFHATPSSAVAAGFRACKRCKPDECFAALTPDTASADIRSTSGGRTDGGPSGEIGLEGLEGHEEDLGKLVLPAQRRQAEAVAKACRLLRQAKRNGERLGIGDVAREVGLTKWHFGRVFRRLMGVGPGEWARKLGEEGAEVEEGTGILGEGPEAAVDEMLPTLGPMEDTSDSFWWDEAVGGRLVPPDIFEMPAFDGLVGLDTPDVEGFDWDQFIDMASLELEVNTYGTDRDMINSMPN
ncbi:MAG: hypothetical protein MMC23_001924 [Stictis urceolatum]|nr:hypothetical protein [Stictis urceolata]